MSQVLSVDVIILGVIFILTQGHACPGLYGAWAEAGVIPFEELKNLRKVDSELEGHPTPVSVASC